ncbi:MAG: transcriptional repressor LexA [Ignavibacteria bacterium]|nr:transcriptional repressor LexA [Ignavibacteria bacterium]MDH7527767.1 transcriptional repressor LexA [Ignavibacteria bacterium]
MAKQLTEIQRRILDYIIDMIATKQILPTLAEIARHFGYKNRATVQQHLRSLEQKGFIKRNPKLARGIELTISDKLFIPRPVLGEVAAGNPLVIYPDAIDTVELPSIVRIPRDSFLLRVKGDSLKDAYIFDGDIIIVNPNATITDGQIVVAILDDSAVVKRFFRQNGTIILKSENKAYKPIEIKADYDKFKVVGAVVGVYRMMKK